MHGVTNVLTNTLKNVIKQCLTNPQLKSTFNEIMDNCLDRRIHTSFKPNSSLIPREMKAFFTNKLHTSLPHMFNIPTLNNSIPYPQPSSPSQSLSFVQAFTFALDAIRYFHDFAYKQFPTPQEIQHLQHARTRLLSFYAGQKWRLTPTTHFMTNEAISFAEADHTTYITLQEGVEHANFDDKVLSTHTLQSSYHAITGESSWQTMLHKQLLKLETQKYNIAPASHTIFPGSSQYNFIDTTMLTPLIGMTF
jgi:hypothetical protein